MKQYKKRTLALVLASVVTVVGAFGAENYKNSLLSLKFEQGSGKVVRMTLLTEKKFNDSELTIIKTNAKTFVVTLPETINDISEEYDLGDNIKSVDISTVPYTTSSRGATKITVNTYENIPFEARTRLYIPAETQELIGTSEPAPEPQQQEVKTSQSSRQSRNNTIQSRSGVNQTSTVDINDSVKQFQTSKPTTEDVEKPAPKKPEVVPPIEQEQEKPNRTQEILYWIMGIAIAAFTSVYLMLRAKEKIAEITGEQGNFDLSDEPKPNEKKKKPAKINTAIKNLDRKYTQPVTMPVAPQRVEETQDIDDDFEQEVENTVVDLDELLQEKNKTAAESNNTEDDENSALEEFLSAYNFDDEEEEENQEETKEEGINEELYDKCITDDKLQFSKDDVGKISTLMNSEISDDAIKNASEFMESSEKDKKPSPLQLLENFVTVYAVKQNVTFTKEDIEALYKLINVEIDNSFITDLRTDPERMKEMQEEIEKRKSKPHKTSELLTLNVKDMLPDLSEALKKQGGRRIESEVKPQVVYYSEGYEVSTLKLNDALPDLSKELNNNEAYKSRPSDDIMYVDTSYEVQKMSIGNDLPDLRDVLKNPDKYTTPEPEPEKVDEEALLKNITNVTFKPFDDGTREFEILNDFDDSNAPSVSDMQEEFKQLGDNFEIVEEEEVPSVVDDEKENDDFESLYDGSYVDLDKDLKSELEKENMLEEYSEPEPLVSSGPSEADKLLEIIQDKEESRKKSKSTHSPRPISHRSRAENKKPPEVIAPEFCILDGERFSVINASYFADRMGCYLAKNDGGYCIIGFVGDKTFRIKHYDRLDNEKIQSRISKKLDDGTLRYLVRIGIHKFILNVKSDNMEFVMDLC